MLGCTAQGDLNAWKSPAPPCFSRTETSGDIMLIVPQILPQKQLYSFTVSGVRNPPSAKTVTGLVIQTCPVQACTTYIDRVASSAALTTTFRPGLQPSAALKVKSDSPQNGYTNANLTVRFTMGNPLVAFGSIQLSLPKSNLNLQDPGGGPSPFKECLLTDCDQSALKLSVSYVDNGGVSYSVPISAWTFDLDRQMPPAECSSCRDTFNADADRLTLELGNTALIPRSYTLVITIGPITNPSSYQPLAGFAITTGDVDRSNIQTTVYPAIDLASTTVLDAPSGGALQTLVPGTFLNDKVTTMSSMSLSNYSISATEVKASFRLTPENGMPLNAILWIQFPASWPLDCDAQYSATGTEYCDFDPADADSQIACESNTLKMYGGWAKGYVEPGQAFVFSVAGLSNPAATAKQFVTVTSYSVNGGMYMIDQGGVQQGLFGAEFLSGVLDVTSIQPTNYTIYSQTGQISLTFSAQHRIQMDYAVVITFPPKLQVLSVPNCRVYGAAPNYLCSTDPTNNRISIKYFVNATVEGGVPITLSFDQVQNPGDYGPVGIVNVSLTNAVGGKIDDGYIIFPIGLFNSSIIPSFQVSADDQTAGLSPASYTFSISPARRVAQGAYLVITFPTEITLADANGLARSCQGSKPQRFVNAPQCRWQATRTLNSSGSVTVTGGFSTDSSVGDPPLLVFGMGYLRNPRSQAPTGMFNVSIYDGSGALLYAFVNPEGPRVQMTKFAQPTSVKYNRSSFENGKLTDYTFQIKIKNYLESGDKLIFTMPTPVRFTSSSRCYGSSYWINGPQNCSFTGDLQTAVMTVNLTQQPRLRNLENIANLQMNQKDNNSIKLIFQNENEKIIRKTNQLFDRFLQSSQQITQIPEGSIINILITNLTSPPSMRPVNGTIAYQVMTKDGYTIEALSQGLIIKNTNYSLLDPGSVGISPDYYEKNTSANYTISFAPKNFERNMIITLIVPSQIVIPPVLKCRGLKGTDTAQLTCAQIAGTRQILVRDAVVSQAVAPPVISFLIQYLINPVNNTITDSFQIFTQTYDRYPIDQIVTGVTVNFFCQFPCRMCLQTDAQHCTSCYAQTTQFKFLFQNQCLEKCALGMLAINQNEAVPTCAFCKYPCSTCETVSTFCTSCPPGWLLYKVDNTCYEQIFWYFPFCCAAGLLFLIVLCVDCFSKSTLFLHSYLFFLCIVEDAVISYLVYLYITGHVKGDRSLAIVSLGTFCLLNLVFIPVHCKSILKKAAPEYLQVFKNFKCSSWFLQLIAYIFNFKMSIILISSFASRPRCSGIFNADSWQKYNIFSGLYILLVYVTFTADFYLYFTTYGLRQLTSYVFMEAIIIMTMISLILMLEILSQCGCTNMREKDLGKRAGLTKEKLSAKKKRRDIRMGNEDEYDDEDDYDSEEERQMQKQLELRSTLKGSAPKGVSTKGRMNPGAIVEEDESYYDDEEYGESYYDEEDDSQAEMLKRGQSKKSLDMLEALALQMKEEKEALRVEKQKLLDEKQTMAEDQQRRIVEQQTKIEEQEEKLRQDMAAEIEARMEQKLKERDINALILKSNKPSIVVPDAVRDNICVSKGGVEPEQVWLQNLTPVKLNASNRSEVLERDASQIDYLSNVTAKKSFLGAVNKDGSVHEYFQNENGKRSQIEDQRSMSDRQEMMMNASAIARDDLSQSRSLHATEVNYLNRSQPNYDRLSGLVEKDASQQNYLQGASAVFSNIIGPGKSAQGTDLNYDNRSNALYDKLSSNTRVFQGADFEGAIPATPLMDQHGHSDESSEAMVADHAPFKGIQEAIANQDKLRKSQRRLEDQRSQNALGSQDSSQRVEGKEESEEAEENQKTIRRIKQVLYSDKSESSVDDMMEDTPSNYNIANGRLEGKSMGLKAILLFAKNQGLNVGEGGAQGKIGGGQLAQIEEETNNRSHALNRQSAQQSSGEGGNWKPLNQPIHGSRGIQIVGQADPDMTQRMGGNTDDKQQKGGKKRIPTVGKQFLEPAERHADGPGWQ